MKITVNKPPTLIEFLAEQYPDSSRTRIKKLLRHGNIRCNNKHVTLHSHKLSAGDVLKSTHTGDSRKSRASFSCIV
jgi:23S rRNA pseudouridine1911/1915/1917 synthase